MTAASKPLIIRRTFEAADHPEPDAIVVSEGMSNRALIDRVTNCPVGTRLYKAAPIEQYYPLLAECKRQREDGIKIVAEYDRAITAVQEQREQIARLREALSPMLAYMEDAMKAGRFPNPDPDIERARAALAKQSTQSTGEKNG